MRKLEVCCGDISSVIAAIKGGADRIELCGALEVGGVTPSIGLIRSAIETRNNLNTAVNIHVLVRPRAGDFCYDDAELDVMLRDIDQAKAIGVEGVVIGALRPDGTVDTEKLRRMVALVPGMEVTFHRAFDMCSDYAAALEQIAHCGCSRILTSGCAATALKGIPILAELVSMAPRSVTILAGSGISPSNVGEILSATGVNEIHASAKKSIPSKMSYRRNGVKMGADNIDEFSSTCTDEDIVRRLAEAVHQL